ncbi:anti-sigma factor antagonist [Amycolatopsis australiensis]|uniref:anti-sigma factor antagonist n=1 Tax=Amycolatopsis australiensis TaxID=546364 RepID=UPI0015A5500E|nr:anti-sigma factor antagonist [Amycolatopsis australiensis]
MSEHLDTERPASGLETTRQTIDGTVVVKAVGEVDPESVHVLRIAVGTGLTEAAGGPCILDLTQVTFLDSVGLTALVDATKRAEQRGGPLRIVVDANRPVIRPIEITGLDDVLRLYHTLDEALRATG